ncbi:MAG TPA: cupin domain-containing protein, partial [Gammaproteobacteria bacterium]|nr:cupin domain-containing protein [Gammaproteobacteria bacterium]
MLNNLTAQQFLSEYWQKKPLLIRQAFPQFKHFLNKEKLMTLAAQDEVESRLITFHNKHWDLTLGPFQKKQFKTLPLHWTLLVQGINHYFQEAQNLVKHFNFIPAARLDDLMVSFATDGSGVGPHIDSYDVFLLQGYGKRVWQISSSKQKHVFVPNIPLKILKNFKVTEEWILEPGDMLYLPPKYAHNGIAMGDCMTYSIGFRAPTYQEFIGRFLEYLHEHCQVEGRYADPNLKLNKNPAQIPAAMIKQVTQILKKIRYNKKDIEN